MTGKHTIIAMEREKRQREEASGTSSNTIPQALNPPSDVPVHTNRPKKLKLTDADHTSAPQSTEARPSAIPQTAATAATSPEKEKQTKKRLTLAQRQQVIALHKSGLKPGVISATTHIPYDSVFGTLKRLEQRGEDAVLNPLSKSYTPSQRSKVLELFDAGLSIKDIAAQLSMPYNTVYKLKGRKSVDGGRRSVYR
jgi:hypothetical protein